MIDHRVLHTFTKFDGILLIVETLLPDIYQSCLHLVASRQNGEISAQGRSGINIADQRALCPNVRRDETFFTIVLLFTFPLACKRYVALLRV
jgi:hypothetical protein